MNITIKVSGAELDPESKMNDYRCKVEILELGFSEYAYGIDALQALCLAVKCLRNLIESLTLGGWKFFLPSCSDAELDIIATYF
ncbi:DUF6968 family protein [Microbulbifer sp. DLAB2-AF]|uniref:DUF6968 family protein n=1 Tax=unclassified Microbulbifer TaxID=2619833 RepID=UPI004039E950